MHVDDKVAELASPPHLIHALERQARLLLAHEHRALRARAYGAAVRSCHCCKMLVGIFLVTLIRQIQSIETIENENLTAAKTGHFAVDFHFIIDHS